MQRSCLERTLCLAFEVSSRSELRLQLFMPVPITIKLRRWPRKRQFHAKDTDALPTTLIRCGIGID
jgi:hypothetical protein